MRSPHSSHLLLLFYSLFIVTASAGAPRCTLSTSVLSSGRTGVAGTALNNIAYFAGGAYDAGHGNSSFSAIVDVLLPDGTSSTLQLSSPRSGMAACSNSQQAFFAGGLVIKNGTAETSDTVDIFTASSGLWSKARLSQGRVDLAATAVFARGPVFFAGGRTSQSVSNVVDIYSPATATWSTATLSVARFDLAAAVVGRRALFAGGFTQLSGSGPSAVVDILDMTYGTWSTSSLSQARGSLASAVVSGKAYFLGGSASLQVNSAQYSNVDHYDPVGNTLAAAGQLSLARGDLAAASLPTTGSVLLVAGGIAGSGIADELDGFNAVTREWNPPGLISRSSGSAARLGKPMRGAAAVALRDQTGREMLLFAGGVTPAGATAQVAIFSCVPPPPPPTDGPTPDSDPCHGPCMTDTPVPENTWPPAEEPDTTVPHTTIPHTTQPLVSTTPLATTAVPTRTPALGELALRLRFQVCLSSDAFHLYLQNLAAALQQPLSCIIVLLDIICDSAKRQDGTSGSSAVISLVDSATRLSDPGLQARAIDLIRMATLTPQADVDQVLTSYLNSNRPSLFVNTNTPMEGTQPPSHAALIGGLVIAGAVPVLAITAAFLVLAFLRRRQQQRRARAPAHAWA